MKLNLLATTALLAIFTLSACGNKSKHDNIDQQRVETNLNPEIPRPLQTVTATSLARKYESNRNLQADVLVLDTSLSASVLLTKTGERISAVYTFENGNLESRNFEGTVPQEWVVAEKNATAMGKSLSIEESEAAIRAFKKILANPEIPFSGFKNHAGIVAETLLTHLPHSNVVIADDFSIFSRECDVVAKSDYDLEIFFDGLLKKYEELVLRHGIKSISRSMGRNAPVLIEYMLRKCPAVSIEHLEIFHLKEEAFLDALTNQLNVLLVNGAPNELTAENYFIDGQTRENPLAVATTKNVIYVGYAT